MNEQNHTNTKQFLTEGNLKRSLCALDEESEADVSEQNEKDNLCNISVVEMQAEKLTIEIKPKEKMAEDVSESKSVTVGSPSIEVIHRRPTPPLHSILKQRTFSESSEDHSLGASSTNIDSIEEETHSGSERKRTVSFNSRVDQACFKSNCSVSSMVPTLKNKRRSQRRRAEKQRKEEKRNRRRNNSGASSGDESVSHESLSDSHSVSEGEEMDDKEKLFQRSVSDPGPSVDAVFAGEKVTGDKEKCEEDSKERSGDVSVKDTEESDDLDFRTKNSLNISEKSAVEQESVSEKKSSPTWNEKVTSEIKEKLSASNESAEAEKDERGRDSDDDEDVDGEGECCSKQDDEEEEESKTTEGESKTTESESGEAEDNFQVDTMLSWEERPRANGGEHATQSAVQFSNEMMFDLDVD